MVQRQAARFVLSNYDQYASITQMLNNIGWTTLSKKREKLRAIMMFKIINNLVEVSTDRGVRHICKSHTLQV